jgi:hypothetical protein
MKYSTGEGHLPAMTGNSLSTFGENDFDGIIRARPEQQ